MKKVFLSAIIAGSLATLDTLVLAEEYPITIPRHINSEQDSKSNNDYDDLLLQIKQKQQQLSNFLNKLPKFILLPNTFSSSPKK